MLTEITCPKCGSNHIVAARKRTPAGAMSGQTFLTCGTGLPANVNTASDIDLSCLRCEHAWNPKKLLEKPVADTDVKSNTAIKWFVAAIVVIALLFWLTR